MSNYEELKVNSGNVTAEFRAAFEKALEDAWQEYNNGARLVDQFEDDYTECAFAKGFLAGCIYRDKL